MVYDGVLSNMGVVSLQASIGRLVSLCKSYNQPTSPFALMLHSMDKVLDTQKDEEGVSLRERWTVVRIFAPHTHRAAPQRCSCTDTNTDAWHQAGSQRFGVEH